MTSEIISLYPQILLQLVLVCLGVGLPKEQSSIREAHGVSNARSLCGEINSTSCTIQKATLSGMSGWSSDETGKHKVIRQTLEPFGTAR